MAICFFFPKTKQKKRSGIQPNKQHRKMPTDQYGRMTIIKICVSVFLIPSPSIEFLNIMRACHFLVQFVHKLYKLSDRYGLLTTALKNLKPNWQIKSSKSFNNSKGLIDCKVSKVWLYIQFRRKEYIPHFEISFRFRLNSFH